MSCLQKRLSQKQDSLSDSPAQPTIKIRHPENENFRVLFLTESHRVHERKIGSPLGNWQRLILAEGRRDNREGYGGSKRRVGGRGEEEEREGETDRGMVGERGVGVK